MEIMYVTFRTKIWNGRTSDVTRHNLCFYGSLCLKKTEAFLFLEYDLSVFGKIISAFQKEIRRTGAPGFSGSGVHTAFTGFLWCTFQKMEKIFPNSEK